MDGMEEAASAGETERNRRTAQRTARRARQEEIPEPTKLECLALFQYLRRTRAVRASRAPTFARGFKDLPHHTLCTGRHPPGPWDCRDSRPWLRRAMLCALYARWGKPREMGYDSRGRIQAGIDSEASPGTRYDGGLLHREQAAQLADFGPAAPYAGRISPDCTVKPEDGLGSALSLVGDYRGTRSGARFGAVRCGAGWFRAVDKGDRGSGAKRGTVQRRHVVELR